jgi:hypothetical protein
MITQGNYIAWLVVWMGCAAGVFWNQRKVGSGAGLTISYVLQLFTIHWLAAAVYALPSYHDADVATLLGFEQSTYAIAGFLVGSSIILPLWNRRHPVETELTPAPIDQTLLRNWLTIGVVSYALVEPLLGNVPTVGALVSSASNMLIVALAVECWNGLQRQGRYRPSFWRWIGLSAVLPIVSIVTKGFLGYGFAAMLTIFAFVASFYRPRWKLVGASLLIGYFALSLYVTYMRDRKDIRALVWGGADFSSRVAAIGRTLTEFELLNLTNPDHLARIDERLNQNFLVGRSVEYLQTHSEGFARGRTIWDAIVAPIPRVIWPSKPVLGGSGELVTEFTGIHFAGQTSVGIGHVLEWFVNFGTAGVFFGMIGIGLLVGWVDQTAASKLYQRDPLGFVMWWLPGLALLQVGGSLAETIGAACAGIVVANLIRRTRYVAPAIPAERLHRPRVVAGSRKPSPAFGDPQ